MNGVLGELGLRPIEPTEIKGMIGDGVLKLLERALAAANGDRHTEDALLPRFSKSRKRIPATLTRCYPGVVETLEALRHGGFRLAVVTNKPIFATNRTYLQALSLAEILPVVISGDSVQRQKHHPAPLWEAVRAAEVDVQPITHQE